VVGHGQGAGGVLLDEEDPDAAVPQGGDLVVEPVDGDGGEPEGELVEQGEAGAPDQQPPEGDDDLFAARERPDRPGLPAAQLREAALDVGQGLAQLGEQGLVGEGDGAELPVLALGGLRELEDEGLVEREVEAGTPVRVTYSLTATGEALGPAIRELKAWAKRWKATG